MHSNPINCTAVSRLAIVSTCLLGLVFAEQLLGADVEVGDLRAGASLILGALAAEGRSTIHGMHHVRRGYEDIEGKLLDLGARIDQEPGS